MTDLATVYDTCPDCGQQGFHSQDCPESASSLGHVPKGTRWEFDDGVTFVFEDMLERSIPQYEVMRRLVFDLACRYRQKGLTILDLGSSRGAALAPLVERFGAGNRYRAVEVSEPMLEALAKRFEGYIDAGVVAVHEDDLRQSFPVGRYCLVQAVLTMMFVPMNYRQRIIQNVYSNLVDGGAFLVVEKVLGSSADLDDALVETYHQHKRDAGYSDEEIRRKALSMEGVLVPQTAQATESMLGVAGFRQVECFWRCMNFAAWVAVK